MSNPYDPPPPPPPSSGYPEFGGSGEDFAPERKGWSGWVYFYFVVAGLVGLVSASWWLDYTGGPVSYGWYSAAIAVFFLALALHQMLWERHPGVAAALDVALVTWHAVGMPRRQEQAAKEIAQTNYDLSRPWRNK